MSNVTAKNQRAAIQVTGRLEDYVFQLQVRGGRRVRALRRARDTADSDRNHGNGGNADGGDGDGGDEDEGRGREARQGGGEDDDDEDGGGDDDDNNNNKGYDDEEEEEEEEEEEMYAFLQGYGSLYNHSNYASVAYLLPPQPVDARRPETHFVDFVARRDVVAGASSFCTSTCIHTVSFSGWLVGSGGGSGRRHRRRRRRSCCVRARNPSCCVLCSSRCHVPPRTRVVRACVRSVECSVGACKSNHAAGAECVRAA